MHGAPVQTSTLHARPTADHVPRLDPVVIAGMREGERQTPKLTRFCQWMRARQGKAIPESKRLSWIGFLIRKTRLDELPQLLNVIVGNMSLIGPRPLLPKDQPANPQVRLSIRPGITGWAQVNGGKLLNAADNNTLDEWYIRNASLWLDLRIVVLTALCMVRGERRSERALAQASGAQTVGPEQEAQLQTAPMPLGLSPMNGQVHSHLNGYANGHANGHAAAHGNGHGTTLGNGHAAPQGNGQAAPQGNGHAAPQGPD